MTYHDAQGNEIEDLEMDKMRVEHCWLCGHTTIYESGLCAFDYFWAEDNTPADASEDEIREAYRAMKPRTDDDGLDSVFI